VRLRAEVASDLTRTPEDEPEPGILQMSMAAAQGGGDDLVDWGSLATAERLT